MSTQRLACLLVGSPRGTQSTSESLGNYLLDRLREHGFATETLRIGALKTALHQQRLLTAVQNCQVLILSAPLYVDAPPAAVIRAMERIAEHRQTARPTGDQHLLAISNGGFPEALHHETALAIHRQFARECGFRWAGGLALGMGEAIAGKPLRRLGGLVRGIRQALDLAADALAAGTPVPRAAVTAMATPLLPAWIYLWMAERRWRQEARRHGVARDLDRRPYARAGGDAWVRSGLQ